MAHGSCLCGSVTWKIDAPLSDVFTCHCSMCRKSHGTAYAAFAMAPGGAVHITSGADDIVPYAATARAPRPFCRTCGSRVPPATHDTPRVSVLLGPLLDADGELPLRAHCFVASKAPWYEITDKAQQLDAWPPGYDLPVTPGRDRPTASDARIRGSCLCGAVEYRLSTPPATMRHCHCTRCRRARGAPHATNAIANVTDFAFTRGEDRLGAHRASGAKYFAQVFCTTCGSPAPRVDASRGIVVIPAGSFDDDPIVRPVAHIFVESKASWLEICDGLPQYAAGIPG